MSDSKNEKDEEDLFSVFKKYNINSSKKNTKILNSILNNWTTIISLKKKSDFFTNYKKYNFVESEPDTSSDELEEKTYNEIEEYQMLKNLKDDICVIFNGKNSRDTRITGTNFDDIIDINEGDTFTVNISQLT